MADDVTLRLGAEVEQAVAKLETVQKKLASIATEVKGGTPIYDAYGRVATTATTKAEEGADKASKANTILGDSVGKMIGAFTAASVIERAVGWLAGMGREALTLSSRVLDVQATTGLALDTIQRLEHIERVTNTTQGALADSAFNLGRNLAGGNDSVRAAAAALGLQFEELQSQRIDESLYDVGDALRDMEDPNERNRLAVALLGKTWKEVAPAVLAEMRAIGAGAYVLADEQIRASDEAMAAMRSAASKTMSFMADVAGSMFQMGRAMAIAVGLASSPIENPSLAAQRQATEALTRETNALSSSYLNATRPVRTLATELAEAEAAVQSLTSSQMVDIATMQRLGYSQEDIGRKYHLNSAALELLRERQDAERKATDDAARATEEANKKARERHDALERIRLATVDVTDQQRTQILSLESLGAAERDIAVKVGVHEVQVRRVIEAERDRTKSAEEAAKAVAAAEKAQAEAQAAAAREVRERVQADGVARLQQAADLHDALIDNERKMALAQTTGLDRRLLELRYAEQDELASLHRTHDASEASTQEVAALIQERYRRERDEATFTATHIVARMREQGVLTRAEQEAAVAALERDWREMQASGEYTFEQLDEAERRWREASARLAHEGLFRFIDNMNQMLDVAGAAFDAIGGLGSDTTAKIGAVGTRIVQTARLGGEAMAAFATGDWVGAAIKSIQAIGTALQGLFKGNETKKAREEFAASMGMDLDGLMKKLQSMGDKGQELANRALNVIGKHDEAGNRRWMDEVKAFFASHEQSIEDSAQAYTDAQEKIGSALAGVTARVGANAEEHTRLRQGLWNSTKAYEELAASGRASQEELAAAALEVSNWQFDMNKAIVTSQDEFDRLSRIALHTFNTLVASGVDPVSAMQRIGTSVDALIANVNTFALSGNAAYDQLVRWRQLTEINAPLLESVGGLNDLMQMTATLGGLNEEAFTDMAAQGRAAYEQLTAAGFTESEALTAMKPMLETLVQLQRDKGFAIDEATQALIDQAREQGILAEEGQDTNSILIDGLGAIIKAVGGELPDAWRRAGASATEYSQKSIQANRDAKAALDGTRQTIEGMYAVLDNEDTWRTWADTAIGHVGRLGQAYQGAVNEPGGGEGAGIPGFASGTGGIRDFGARTLAWLHGLEGVFTRDQIDGIVQSAGLHGARAAAFGYLAEASASVGVGGVNGATHVITNNTTIDGRGAFFTNEQGMRSLVDRVSDGLVDKFNRMGFNIRSGA